MSNREQLSVDWLGVWEQVAATLTAHVRAGRTHLLTEDVVRFSTALALQDHGVDCARIAFEYRLPGIGPIDVVGGSPPLDFAVELKFPRDPKQLNAADTMTFGELLNDFYRLARIEAMERWAVQVIGSRLARHLARRRELRWTLTAGETLAIPAGIAAALPLTARRAAVAAVAGAVKAIGVAAHPVGPELVLAAYRVDRVLDDAPALDPGPRLIA